MTGAVSPLSAPGGAWAIDTAPTPDGVALSIAFVLDGRPITARFALPRQDARTLSDSLRRDAGDGERRTFPHPPTVRA